MVTGGLSLCQARGDDITCQRRRKPHNEQRKVPCVILRLSSCDACSVLSTAQIDVRRFTYGRQ